MSGAPPLLRFMLRACFSFFFAAIASTRCASAQFGFTSPELGKAIIVQKDCDSASKQALSFLLKRGLKIESDWACTEGFRCIHTDHAAPRGATGKRLSRSKIIADYLKNPSEAKLGFLAMGDGNWRVTDSNFMMSSFLQVKPDGPACSVKLTLNFDLGYSQFVVVLPIEYYRGGFRSNGKLESEYLDAIFKP